jgi:iron complex outermembrane receptor protein
MRSMLVLALATSFAAVAQDLPVTGSQIAGAPSLSDVRVIGRAELEASGYASFGDFLQRLTEQGGAENPNVNNGGDGSTQLALHNLGSLRTLVLVDGKRWVPYSASGAVDLTSIPTASIDRIEILQSGGAAVYGSGAMAGVVNVITRKRAEATEASALGGISSRGDARQYDLSVSSGVESDKTNFFFSAGYSDREALLSGARGFARTRLFDGPEGGSPVGPTTLILPAIPAKLYDFQSVNDLVTPAQTLSLFSNAEVRFSPIARAYFQGSFVNRRSSDLLAAEPLSPLTVDANNTFNPTGQTIQVSRRIVEAGGRTDAEDLNTLRAVLGIDGGLPSGLTFDLSFNFGRTSGTIQTTGTFEKSSLTNSLGPSFSDASGLHCGTVASGAIAGCVPANVFGTLTPAMLASMGLHTGTSDSFMQLASTRLELTQTLFQLGPAREATLAFGYEYRAEYGGLTPDPIALAGQDTDFGGALIVGSFHSNEGHAELDLPVLAQLDLRGALRVVDDSGFGAAAAWDLGVRWQPLRDIILHASYSSAYRAPGIAERFDTTPVQDLCDNGLCPARPLGNPQLEPEKSLNAVAGVSFEPQLVRGLFVSLDYWNIAITQAIGIPGCPETTAICFLNGPESNAGGVTTSGLDLGFRYSQPSPAGRFGLRATISYLLRYDENVQGPEVSAAGNYDLGFGSAVGGLTPRMKVNAAIDWKLGSLAAALSGRFIGGFEECTPMCSVGPAEGVTTLSHSVPAYLSLDLYASYSIGGTLLTAGVHNLFDANPPLVYGSFLAFADPAYDFTGRSVYARATQRF